MSLEDTISRLLSSRPPPAEPELRAAVDEHERSQQQALDRRPTEVEPDLIEVAPEPPAPTMVTTTGVCGVCQERVDDGHANGGRRPGCGHSIHMTCFARLVRSNRARCTLCPAPAVDSDSAERLGGYTVDVGHDADVHASVAQALEYRRITVRDQLIVEAHARMGTFGGGWGETLRCLTPFRASKLVQCNFECWRSVRSRRVTVQQGGVALHGGRWTVQVKKLRWLAILRASAHGRRLSRGGLWLSCVR